MTKTHTLLLILALFAGAIVLYANKDWFSKPPIQISHRFEASGSRFAQAPGTLPLFFEFNRPLQLKSVKVFLLSDLQTNKSAHPVWHLRADSRSAPTRGFYYGTVVPGMRADPQEPGAPMLDPRVPYRLVVEAGFLKAQHDFALEPTEPTEP